MTSLIRKLTVPAKMVLTYDTHEHKLFSSVKHNWKARVNGWKSRFIERKAKWQYIVKQENCGASSV